MTEERWTPPPGNYYLIGLAQKNGFVTIGDIHKAFPLSTENKDVLEMALDTLREEKIELRETPEMKV